MKHLIKKKQKTTIKNTLNGHFKNTTSKLGKRKYVRELEIPDLYGFLLMNPEKEDVELNPDQ